MDSESLYVKYGHHLIMITINLKVEWKRAVSGSSKSWEQDAPGSVIEDPALEEGLTKSVVEIAIRYGPVHNSSKVQNFGIMGDPL
jgi:hypothetical protein